MRQSLILLFWSYQILCTANPQVNGGVQMTSPQNPPEENQVMEDDKKMLSALNAQFIRNFLTQDAEAHAKIIHGDFVCIENDGQIVHRDQYLKEWASAWDNSGYLSFSYTDEFIRIFGTTALVRSKTVYTKKEGGKIVQGNSVYTDTYVKENGQWLCVQAQITPVKHP